MRKTTLRNLHKRSSLKKTFIPTYSHRFSQSGLDLLSQESCALRISCVQQYWKIMEKILIKMDIEFIINSYNWNTFLIFPIFLKLFHTKLTSSNSIFLQNSLSEKAEQCPIYMALCFSPSMEIYYDKSSLSTIFLHSWIQLLNHLKQAYKNNYINHIFKLPFTTKKDSYYSDSCVFFVISWLKKLPF